jgi:hypothetical protein
MNRFMRRLASAMLLGVAVYLFFALYTGVRKIELSLMSFHWSAFGIALGLATMNYAIRFLKWQHYLKRLGVHSVPVFDSLLVFLSGFVLTVTPGKVGEIFKRRSRPVARRPGHRRGHDQGPIDASWGRRDRGRDADPMRDAVVDRDRRVRGVVRAPLALSGEAARTLERGGVAVQLSARSGLLASVSDRG